MESWVDQKLNFGTEGFILQVIDCKHTNKSQMFREGTCNEWIHSRSIHHHYDWGQESDPSLSSLPNSLKVFSIPMMNPVLNLGTEV